MAEEGMRIERDSMGEVKVPSGAYYGASTERARQNFPISSLRLPRRFIRALAQIKGAAALVNAELGLLETRLANPVMKGGEAGKNYLRIALQGCRPEPTENRTPVNVSFVIDRSGSMSGARIEQARSAAIMAINRLQPTDIASVVIFDQTVDVLVPAQHVTDPNQITDFEFGHPVAGFDHAPNNFVSWHHWIN